MRASKKRKLEAAGWTVGSAADFLGLGSNETALVEMKLSLADSLRERRVEKALTQSAVASLIGSSQSRVAKMEAADASVSLDLMVKALLALGASRREVADAIGKVAA